MAAQPLRLLDVNSSHATSADRTGGDCYGEPCHVSVATGDVLPLLLDAALTNRAWLEDFAEDTMEIPRDLYEVLLAYRRYRREAA